MAPTLAYISMLFELAAVLATAAAAAEVSVHGYTSFVLAVAGVLS